MATIQLRACLAIACALPLLCLFQIGPVHNFASEPKTPDQTVREEQLPRYFGASAIPANLPNRIVTVALKTFNGLQPVTNPAWLAYDHADQSFYVAVPPSSVDLVPFDSGALPVNATIPVGSSPFGVAVDNATGQVFVTNTASDNVSVISGTSPAVVGTIAVGAEPYGVVYDPSADEIFVTNGGSNDVSVISGATLTVVDTIPVGAGPLGIAFDPATNAIFVDDRSSDQVSVISGASLHLIATVDVGQGPYGVAVDTVADEVYVTNQGSSNLSVISAATDAVIATVPVVSADGPANLSGVAFDPSDNLVWAGAGRFYAVVVDPTSRSVVAFSGTDPSGAVFDSDNGDVCLTNTANRTFECYLYSDAGWPATVPVNFTETGLPAGTSWNVTLCPSGPTQSSITSTVAFSLFSQSGCSYTVWPTAGYAVNPSSGVVDVGSSPTTVSVVFVAAPGPYPVAFNESGLPSGTSWSIEVGGDLRSSTGTSLSFSLTSGTYPYQIADVPGWHEYSVPYSGLIGVNGGAVDLPTLFFVPFEYIVNFSESGLANSTVWSVTINGDTETAGNSFLTFWEGNGTYAYTVATAAQYATPAPGQFTVNGANRTIDLTFARTYNVTFGEAGLPSGTGWNVTLGGIALGSTSNEIQFSVPNGTLVFAIGAPTGFAAIPASGTLVVAGAPVAEGVSFAPIPTGEYAVTFTETGLAAGIGWSVTVSNHTLSIQETEQAVAPSSIIFDLPNGTYGWGVFVPAGYSSGIPPGLLVVNGAATVAAALSFSSTGAGSSPPSSSTLLWFELGAGVAVALAVGIGIGSLLSRKRTPPGR